MPSLFVQLLSGEIFTYRSRFINHIRDLRCYVARNLGRDKEELTFFSITGEQVSDNHRILHEIDEVYHLLVSPYSYALSYCDKTFFLHRVTGKYKELLVSYVETEESFASGETAFYWVATHYGSLPSYDIELEYNFDSDEVYELMSRDLFDAGEIVPEEKDELVQNFCKELLNVKVKVN
jgi:hypothetical protein